MKTITRLITGEDNKSHFEEIMLKFEMLYPDWNVKSSQNFSTNSFTIWEADVSELLWVNAPQKQFFIYLSGLIEIQVGDGTKKRFRKGDILLVEDLKGQGHITRIIEPMTAMVIIMDILLPPFGNSCSPG